MLDRKFLGGGELGLLQLLTDKECLRALVGIEVAALVAEVKIYV